MKEKCLKEIGKKKSREVMRKTRMKRFRYTDVKF